MTTQTIERNETTSTAVEQSAEQSTATAQAGEKLIHRVRVSNRRPSSVRQPAASDGAGFDLKAWEARLSQCSRSTEVFELWSEGVAFTEQAFTNYQDALLAVLQNIYAFYYKTEKEIRSIRKTVYETVDKKLGESVSKKAGGFASKLVKLAWQQAEEAADDAQRRALQKRISTYATAMRNAFTQGEEIAGMTDSDGRVLPAHFAEVVKSLGGVSVFSRKSRKQLAEEQELKLLLEQAGCKSEDELNARNMKDCVVEGRFTDPAVLLADSVDISLELGSYEVQDDLSAAIDIPDGDLALLLVSNTDGKKYVRSVICGEDDASVIEEVLLHERKALVKKLEKAVERELTKHKANEGKGKTRKMYVNGVQFSEAEMARLEKLAFKATEMGFKGDLNQLLTAMLDSHCEDKVRHEETA